MGSFGMCAKNQVVAAIECDSACEKFFLKCKPLTKSYRVRNDSLKRGPWIGGRLRIKNANRGKCDKGYYVIGLECLSTNNISDCDEVKPLCAKVEYFNEGVNPSKTRSPSAAPSREKDCIDYANWSDVDGFTCEDYEDKNWCRKYGSMFTNRRGQNADRACCACGGGYDL